MAPLAGAATLLALEAALIPFPVADSRYDIAADEDGPPWRWRPMQEFTWSRGWNFKVVNRVRVNNYGFVSDYDYDAGAAAPLVAVIGDSFVEAVMVPHGQTCAGRLAAHAAPRLRIYAFAMSGAPLSEYLATAQYVRDEFSPSGMVFVVVANDFHESWRKYSWGLPLSHFEEVGGEPVLARVPHPGEGWWRRTAKRSRLVRYLHDNAGLGMAHRIWEARRTRPEVVMPTDWDCPARECSAMLADSRSAVDRFFELLPEMSSLPPNKIAFVVDGPRSALYSEGGLERIRDGHQVLARQYFMAAAEARGYEVLDLLPAFADDWKRNRVRFDWPDDDHWNARGHAVCFEAVARSALVAESEE